MAGWTFQRRGLAAGCIWRQFLFCKFYGSVKAKNTMSGSDKLLLYTHTCPVTEFAVASHLNTANSCCHHVFLRHFRFQKCLPVYSNDKLA